VLSFAHQLNLSSWMLQSLIRNATVVSATLGSSTDFDFRVSGLDSPSKYTSELAVTKGQTFHPAWLHQYRLHALRPGSVVVDIGGNVGIVPIVLDALVQQQSTCSRPHRVLSVEPVPENMLFLRWNLADLHRRPSPCGHISTTAVHRALTSDGRNVSLVIGSRSMSAHVVPTSPGGGPGRRHARRASAPRAPSAPPPRTYTVRSSSLESLLRDHDIDTVDLLKLDCEGCEYEVLDELRSKPELIRRIRHLAGELHLCHPRLPTGKRCLAAQEFITRHWPATPTQASLMRPHGFAIV